LIFIIGLIVPYDDPKLLSFANGFSFNASPFVVAIHNADIPRLDTVYNIAISMTIFSVAHSSVYASSRVLVSLSAQKYAPRILSYVDVKGRPLVAIGVAFVFGLLAFFSQLHDEIEVFKYLLALCGTSSCITWGGICIAHIRFRKACKANNLIERLPYFYRHSDWGSYVALVINATILIIQATKIFMTFN